MIPRLEEISFHEDAAPTDVAKAFEQYGAVILKSSFPTEQVELIGRRAASVFDYIEAEVVAGRYRLTCSAVRIHRRAFQPDTYVAVSRRPRGDSSRRLPLQCRAIAHADTRRGNVFGGLKFLFAVSITLARRFGLRKSWLTAHGGQ